MFVSPVRLYRQRALYSARFILCALNVSILSVSDRRPLWRETLVIAAKGFDGSDTREDEGRNLEEVRCKFRRDGDFGQGASPAARPVNREVPYSVPHSSDDFTRLEARCSPGEAYEHS